MKAARIHEYGNPNVFQIEDLPIPEAGPKDVVIKVHASSVNPVDYKLRSGSQRGAIRLSLPFTLGMDVSGVVSAIGSDVTDFSVGDEVWGSPSHKRQGTYAEYVLVRAEELALKPKTVDHQHAAGLPLVGLTAWRCLVDIANVQPGDKVLIQAGSGGVGSFAIQLAKHLGATVATTCSTRNIALCKSLGADIVVDYTQAQFEDVLEPQDVVLEALGGDIQKRSAKVLRRGGKLVAITSGLPKNTEKFGPNLGLAATGISILSFKLRTLTCYGVKHKMAVRGIDRDALNQIAQLVDAGKIKPLIDSVFPLEQITAAHEKIETGRAQGKIIITVAD